jgi:hypothetical protein
MNCCYVIIFRATVVQLSPSDQQVLLCLYTFSCLVSSYFLIAHTVSPHVQMIFWTLNTCCIQILSVFQTSFSLVMRSCVARDQTTTWPQVTDDLIFLFTAVITSNSKHIICKYITKYYSTLCGSLPPWLLNWNIVGTLELISSVQWEHFKVFTV